MVAAKPRTENSDGGLTACKVVAGNRRRTSQSGYDQVWTLYENIVCAQLSTGVNSVLR